jgi:hypothetical protein
MDLKNGCALISSKPRIPLPSLTCGSGFRNYGIKKQASRHENEHYILDNIDTGF